MGGHGSTRWGAHAKATTLDECLVLDAIKLARAGLMASTPATGTLRWTRVGTGEETASVGFARTPAGERRLTLRLDYRLARSGESVSLQLSAEMLRPVMGGERWLFRCPLVVGGRRCTRRAGKLYLPP